MLFLGLESRVCLSKNTDKISDKNLRNLIKARRRFAIKNHLLSLNLIVTIQKYFCIWLKSLILKNFSEKKLSLFYTCEVILLNKNESKEKNLRNRI